MRLIEEAVAAGRVTVLPGFGSGEIPRADIRTMPEAIAAAVAIGLRVVPIRKGRRSYVRVSSPTDEGRDFAAGGFVPYVRAAVERYRATGKIGVIRNISYRIDSGYGRGARA